jgi:hypothetical protein
LAERIAEHRNTTGRDEPMDPGRIDFLVDIAYGVLIFVAIVLI